MVIFDVDNITTGKFEAPTPKSIEAQRVKQLEAVVRIRQLLADANARTKDRAA